MGDSMDTQVFSLDTLIIACLYRAGNGSCLDYIHVKNAQSKPDLFNKRVIYGLTC